MLSWVALDTNSEASLICLNKKEKKRVILTIRNSEWIVSCHAKYDIRAITFDTYSPAFYILIKWVIELNPDYTLPNPPEEQLKRFMKSRVVRDQLLKEIVL